MPRMNTCIVIPAYNEEMAIADVIRGLSGDRYTVLVVDDGSSDGTARRAKEAGAVVVRHPINLGQGAALQTGIDYAVAHGAQYIVTFDADGQHHPEDVETLLCALQEKSVDIVMGSRFLGAAENIPWSRKLLLKWALLFTRSTGGPKLTDVHNGLRAFRSEVAPLIRIQQPRMAHASELLYKIKKARLRFLEVPITVSYTEYSQHKGQHGMSGMLDIVTDLIVGRNIR